ncbi:hypothetical protein WCP94_001971 [Bilophila wadsworthia]
MSRNVFPKLRPYANVPTKAHALAKINSKTISNMLFNNFPLFK